MGSLQGALANPAVEGGEGSGGDGGGGEADVLDDDVVSAVDGPDIAAAVDSEIRAVGGTDVSEAICG
jgi:hypothetical protein